MEEIKKQIPKWIDINNPEFDEKTNVHDWRNHIPEEIENIWGTLTERERILLCFVAEESASNEHWD